MILIQNMQKSIDFCMFFDAFLPLLGSKKGDFDQNLPSTTNLPPYRKAFVYRHYRGVMVEW